MTRSRRRQGPKQHRFRDKLLLNQWLLSLFGLDPLSVEAGKERPFRLLSRSLLDERMEGLDADNLHLFYHNLVSSDLLWNKHCTFSKEQLLVYEQNIVSHTQEINRDRRRPIVWKYYQWLTLLFVEAYLDQLFRDPQGLLASLNDYVTRFNTQWSQFEDVPLYTKNELNKVCLQNATGSGKTLLMHVNLLQYRHYAKLAGREKELSRVILITPNEQLSTQHLAELAESSIDAEHYVYSRGRMMGLATGLKSVDVLEITKLADQAGPNTVETRSLGEQNLLLVDEGHLGLSSNEKGAWFSRRSALSAKGFTFEYSATFEQAASASSSRDMENSYAKSVLFDYSYRWFYEDGFGKDYNILNLPSSFDEVRSTYLTACLLKYYQQLRLFEERQGQFVPFNLEKPLWVFVGSTVSSTRGNKTEQAAASDVAQVVQFVAEFLADRKGAERRISEILQRTGRDTGLMDANGNDIFQGAYRYLSKVAGLDKVSEIYTDILRRLFNNTAGGQLRLSRITGDSGEIALFAGNAKQPFALINVGDAKGLSDHLVEVADAHALSVSVMDSDFHDPMFDSVKDSRSPINLLIGSKKFVEGWDCWRVSTLGLMHVGKNEGAQIIQLFGRGVRLKGHGWSLKRSTRTHGLTRPAFIEDLETLNVFGIESDFMDKFRQFLENEGLPGNERKIEIEIPMRVNFVATKELKTLATRRRDGTQRAYNFENNGPVPTLGEVPKYLVKNPVVSDWYPRIQSVHIKRSVQQTRDAPVRLGADELAFIDYDQLWLVLEQYKRQRGWNNLNITKAGIKKVLANSSWYWLYFPAARLVPSDFDGVRLLQQVVTELMKRYCDKFYNYCKKLDYEPRLEYRQLVTEDVINERDVVEGKGKHKYVIKVDERHASVIHQVEQLKEELARHSEYSKPYRRGYELRGISWHQTLLQPLFHVRAGGQVTVHPFVLNESEYQFVEDLHKWHSKHSSFFKREQMEIHLLRNSSNSGLGFFEADNFLPDFILWVLHQGKQLITFVEPHGLVHEGPGSPKIMFYETIKGVEARLGDPSVTLHSFILSWTEYLRLQWKLSQQELEDQHVLFMRDDREHYIGKLFARLGIEPA